METEVLQPGGEQTDPKPQSFSVSAIDRSLTDLQPAMPGRDTHSTVELRSINRMIRSKGECEQRQWRLWKVVVSHPLVLPLLCGAGAVVAVVVVVVIVVNGCPRVTALLD